VLGDRVQDRFEVQPGSLRHALRSGPLHLEHGLEDLLFLRGFLIRVRHRLGEALYGDALLIEEKL
jgi:hypothetical protein